ncbi:ABC-ATPase domain-containing protein [Streptococcus dentiloxodontae]
MTATVTDLQKKLEAIDGKGYGAYKQISGVYAYHAFTLCIEQVQIDPYAPPSSIKVVIKRDIAAIPDDLLDTKTKRIAAADFLAREFKKAVSQQQGNIIGTDTSGLILIDAGGQEMIERTAVSIKKSEIDIRFNVGLPASGRRILGKKASRIFTSIVPQAVTQAFYYKHIDAEKLNDQVSLMIDQEHIREELAKRKLVAFIANGSLLPRKSGISDKPLEDGTPFQSPASDEAEIALPSGKVIKGMGIKEGVTLIVGGGYHGKSTLLEALQRDVYNHIPNDGRDYVITRHDAVKIRAEDGRQVEKVNVSPFINHLPNEKDTKQFSTENASSSTSQAANVMEALETGTSLLLIDEDTSATNFMIRDSRMQRLVTSDKEPIAPFIDRVRQLYQQQRVSTILIVGGSGDYFDVADDIIMMDEYLPKNVTDKAKDIAAELESQRTLLLEEPFQLQAARIPLKASFPLSGKEGRFKVKGKYTILYGHQAIDLSGLEQLVDSSQTNSLAIMLAYIRNNLLDNQTSLKDIVDRLYIHIEKNGLESLTSYAGIQGSLALPRKQEVMAALNRCRGLSVRVL